MTFKFTLPLQKIDIVRQYPKLFDTSAVGILKGVQASLRISNGHPAFIKNLVVPISIRSKNGDALEKLVIEYNIIHSNISPFVIG